MVIMLWGLSWEKMTLGRANFLTVVSYLIQNAVLRVTEIHAGPGREALQPWLPESWTRRPLSLLVQAYVSAEERNLVECILLDSLRYRRNTTGRLAGAMIEASPRQRLHRHHGRTDGLYVLLANTGAGKCA